MSEKRAIVDEDLPRSITTILRQLDWEVDDVRDVGLRGRSDEDVLSFAKRRKAVLFSGDWDFANILRFPPRRYPGIVILSFPSRTRAPVKAAETKKALTKISFRDFRRHLVIIAPGRIRIRK